MENDLHQLLVRPAYDVAALMPLVSRGWHRVDTTFCIAGVARLQKKEEDTATSRRVEKRGASKDASAFSYPFPPEVDVKPDFGK